MTTSIGAARRAGWAAMGLIVVVLLVVGARTTPTSGTSEDRVYALASQMKCLQCAGESVAGSQADIAQKMRTEIRKQVRRGRTDDEILGYFADRYGQRVLLNPSGDGVAALVWVVPVVVAGAGIAGLGLAFAAWRRQRSDAGAVEVTADDRELVAEAMAAAHAGAAAATAAATAASAPEPASERDGE